MPKSPLISEHNLLRSASNSERATTDLPLLPRTKPRRRIASCNTYQLASLGGALHTAGSAPDGASAILSTIVSAMASRYCASDRSRRTAPVWPKPRRNPACRSIFSMWRTRLRATSTEQTWCLFARISILPGAVRIRPAMRAQLWPGLSVLHTSKFFGRSGGKI